MDHPILSAGNPQKYKYLSHYSCLSQFEKLQTMKDNHS